MSFLPVLLELQAIHDNLSVIQRDLTAFPPDMARLDSDLKILVRKVDTLSKGLSDARASQAALSKELGLAQKAEDVARTVLKNSTQKIQYTAAIRDLDERERQKAAIAKPLKDVEARILILERDLAEATESRDRTQEQFEELHRIFLSEHENQIQAQQIALSRKLELEAKLEPVELGRFNRLIQGRHGQAVVTVENGTCTGCRTRLRGPLLAQLREKTTLNCESCQRILYSPAKV
jgi:predicted  nucleic acid-binding Zn-ribbon protein